MEKQLLYRAKKAIRIFPVKEKWPDRSDVSAPKIPGHRLICPAAFSIYGTEYSYWRPDLFCGRPQRMLLVLRRRIARGFVRRQLASLLCAGKPTAPSGPPRLTP
jgi:hypothetical protein